MEKSIEQAAQEKEMLSAMKNAQKHMAVALARIERLEHALKQAAQELEYAADKVSPSVYEYNSDKKTRDIILSKAVNARSVLNG